MVMTVYALQEQMMKDPETDKLVPKFDLSAAEKFGAIEFLLPAHMSPFNTAPVLEELYIKLQDFSEDDHILLIGNPVFIGLATAVAAEYSSVVTFLQWSGQYKDYIEIKSQISFNR